MLKFSGCSCLSSGRRLSVDFSCEAPLLCESWDRVRGRGPSAGMQPRGVAYQSAVPRPGIQGRVCSSAEPLTLEGSDTATSATALLARSPLVIGEAGPEGRRGGVTTLSQACPRPKPWAQFAFKNSMIHMILQFTLGIAFRCVLHRCGSQDIRC